MLIMGVPLPADRHDAGIEYLGTPGGICGNIKIVNELVAVLPAESVAGRDGSTAADGDQRQRKLLCQHWLATGWACLGLRQVEWTAVGSSESRAWQSISSSIRHCPHVRYPNKDASRPLILIGFEFIPRTTSAMSLMDSDPADRDKTNVSSMIDDTSLS